MTPSQIAWAAAHDWFVQAVAGGVEVVERATMPVEALMDAPWLLVVVGPAGEGRVATEQLLTFTDYQALRAWAGY